MHNEVKSISYAEIRTVGSVWSFYSQLGIKKKVNLKAIGLSGVD